MSSVRHQVWRTGNTLDEHVALIRRQIQTSIADPSTRMLAAAVVSGNFDNYVDPRTGVGVPAIPYHGRWYRGAQSWEAARSLCAMRDYSCEVAALWNLGVLNVRYTSEDGDGGDTYQTVRATLEAGAGDCDDSAIFFAALLKTVGFQDIIARIVSVHGDSWDHIYLLVKLPRGGWLAMDPTEYGKQLGWEYKNVAARRDFAL